MMSAEAHSSEAGFTLIEVLVALGVFSIAGMALVQLSSESTRAASAFDSRFLAEVTAENLLAETYVDPGTLVLGVTTGNTEQRGHKLDWTRIVAATPRNGLVSIDVSVRDPDTGQTLFRLNTLRPER